MTQESQTKIYPNLIKGVTEALVQVFTTTYPADKVLERMFQYQAKWGSRDRSFVAETTYEIIRHYRRLYETLGKRPVHPEEFRRLVGWYLHLNGHVNLPEWLLEPADIQRDPGQVVQTDLPFPVQHSYPDWLHAMCMEELGDQWPPLAEALNRQADLNIRVNTLKISREALQAHLQAKGYATQAAGDAGLVLARRLNVFKLDAFKSGWFEVQDIASQAVSEVLAPQPGELVIDACAGAGGKTLHLAALMQNKGRILALDPEGVKLTELRRRATRAGVDTVEARLIDSTKTIKRLEGKADRLLLDVPCSGLGVIRRNPDTKWRLKNSTLKELRQTQAEILDKYPDMLRPGGTLVYATCSILPSENERQVALFLSQHPEFELAHTETLYPHTFGYDGFFIAKMIRNG